jgi:hypothetical protein
MFVGSRLRARKEERNGGCDAKCFDGNPGLRMKSAGGFYRESSRLLGKPDTD